MQDQTFSIIRTGEPRNDLFGGPVVDVWCSPAPVKGMTVYCSDGYRRIGGPYTVMAAGADGCTLLLAGGNTGVITIDMLFSTMLYSSSSNMSTEFSRKYLRSV